MEETYSLSHSCLFVCMYVCPSVHHKPFPLNNSETHWGTFTKIDTKYIAQSDDVQRTSTLTPPIY